MSSLLERNSDIKDLMNQGGLVPDTMVRSPPALCSRDRVLPAGMHPVTSRASCFGQVDTLALALTDRPGPAIPSSEIIAETLSIDKLDCSPGG